MEAVKTELKTFRYACDRIGCGTEVIIQAAQFQDPFHPEGWVRQRVHNCGMTGYSKDEIYCSESCQYQSTLD